MTFLRRCCGIIIALLGLVGALICVAGVFGSWEASSRLDAFNKKIFEQADVWLTKLDQQAGVIHDSISTSRDLISTDLNQPEDEVNEAVLEKVLQRPEVVYLEKRLASMADRISLLIQGSEITIEVIDQWIEATDLGLTKSSEKISRLGIEIRDTKASLEKLMSGIRDTENCVDKIRRQEEAVANYQSLLRLRPVMVKKVEEVDQRLEDLRGEFRQQRERLTTIQQRVQLAIRVGWYAIVGFLAWIGLGQLLMIRSGWRWIFGSRQKHVTK